MIKWIKRLRHLVRSFRDLEHRVSVVEEQIKWVPLVELEEENGEFL